MARSSTKKLESVVNVFKLVRLLQMIPWLFGAQSGSLNPVPTYGLKSIAEPLGSGIKNILKVMKDIVSNKVKFVMIGNGALFNYTKNFINKNNLKGKIILLGNLPYKEVIKIYKASDIIVFPSIWQEPFGRIAIEAMAASKPIVASNVGGIKDIVNNTGYLVNPNNLNEWSKKINRLVRDKKLRNKLGKQGRKEVEKYNSNKIAKQIEKIYLQ